MPASAVLSNKQIPVESIIIGFIAILLIGYLLVAMLHPEKF
jgi:K+-transporting ATPase KdpF subunit